jgi:hypothetical protein
MVQLPAPDVDQPRFQIVARAGAGAHADVLSAREQCTGALVAIKRLFYKPQVGLLILLVIQVNLGTAGDCCLA